MDTILRIIHGAYTKCKILKSSQSHQTRAPKDGFSHPALQQGDYYVQS